MYHHFLFPSVVSIIDCENFDTFQSKLIEWIYQYKKTDSGVVISNVGGWQSQSNFFEDATFAEYRKYIWDHVEKIFQDLLEVGVSLDNMWINVNQKGNFNWPHVHPEAHFAGVFWIKCPKNSGSFLIESPHSFDHWKALGSYKHNYKNEYYLTTNWQYESFLMEGKIMTFPANLRHGVSVNNSDEDRISIAFNVRVNDK